MSVGQQAEVWLYRAIVCTLDKSCCYGNIPYHQRGNLNIETCAAFDLVAIISRKFNKC